MYSRAGESSKNKVPGWLKQPENRTQFALDAGPVFGTQFSQKICNFCGKKCFQMEPKLEPKSALGGTSFTYFHPWVVKVAQLVPDGTQRLPRVPKDYQNGAKMLPKVMKTWPCRHLNNCDSPNGGPSSKLYNIYIYLKIMDTH